MKSMPFFHCIKWRFYLETVAFGLTTPTDQVRFYLTDVLVTSCSYDVTATETAAASCCQDANRDESVPHDMFNFFFSIDMVKFRISRYIFTKDLQLETKWNVKVANIRRKVDPMQKLMGNWEDEIEISTLDSHQRLWGNGYTFDM